MNNPETDEWVSYLNLKKVKQGTMIFSTCRNLFCIEHFKATYLSMVSEHLNFFDKFLFRKQLDNTNQTSDI